MPGRLRNLPGPHTSKPRGRPSQKGFADDDLPAQARSLAPILGEDQEEKEEVSPSLSRCRPPSRVADTGPKAKVSHHLMLPSSSSLSFYPRMCGLNPEPNSSPDLSPANNSSNPEALESRGRPNHGLADDHFLPEPRVLPQQVGHAEVLPGRVRNLPGPRTSRPRVQPQQRGLADDLRQSRLQQMSPQPRARPQQVGFAEVLPGRVQNLPGLRISCVSQPSA